MANTSKQCGLRPIDQPYGNIRCNIYKMATGADIFLYEPVQLTSDGYAQLVACSSASTTVPILGSVIGLMTSYFGPIDDAQSYIPAAPASGQVDSSGLINVQVADDPDQFFVLEEDTGGTALTKAAVGLGGCFTIQGATTGNTATGISNYVLDRSRVGTEPSSSLSLQLIKLWDKPDNAYGNYAKWIVRINDHQFKRQTLNTASALI